MAGMNRRAVMEHLGLVPSILENPEVSAMTEICEILRRLPDDDSRLRVMRWSFGRFNPEFKRPIGGEPVAAPVALPTPVALPAPVAPPVSVAPPAPVAAPVLVPRPTPVPPPVAAPEADPMDADIRTEIAAVAPEILAPPAPRRRDLRDVNDFGSQLSELSDLFPERPASGSEIDAF